MQRDGNSIGTGLELKQGVWAVVVTFLVAIAFASMAPHDPQLRLAAGFLAALAVGLTLAAWRMAKRSGPRALSHGHRHARRA